MMGRLRSGSRVGGNGVDRKELMQALMQADARRQIYTLKNTGVTLKNTGVDAS